MDIVVSGRPGYKRIVRFFVISDNIGRHIAALIEVILRIGILARLAKEGLRCKAVAIPNDRGILLDGRLAHILEVPVIQGVLQFAILVHDKLYGVVGILLHQFFHFRNSAVFYLERHHGTRTELQHTVLEIGRGSKPCRVGNPEREQAVLVARRKVDIPSEHALENHVLLEVVKGRRTGSFREATFGRR